MKTEEAIVLIGGGGHCRSCIDVIEEEGKYAIAGIVVRDNAQREEAPGYEIIGTDADLPRLVKEYRNFHIAFGQIRSSHGRLSCFRVLEGLGATLPVIVSPYARVSRRARTEGGTIVMHNAVINSGARIGRNCIINTGALVEHDATVGDCCHIAPAAVVNGGVTIGPGSFVGSNAVIREYLTIGAEVVIGMGVVVREDIPDATIVTGNPAAGRGRR